MVIRSFHIKNDVICLCQSNIFLNMPFSEKIDKNLILIHEIKADSSFNKIAYLMLCREILQEYRTEHSVIQKYIDIEHSVRRDTIVRGGTCKK